jgi:PhnB protein
MSIGETELMGSDVPSVRFQLMHSVYLSLSVNSIYKAKRIVGLLSDDPEIFMPMQETFFAFRFAIQCDRSGTS